LALVAGSSFSGSLMRASLQKVSDTPPVWVLRVHDGEGDWEKGDPFFAAATVVVYLDTATILGFVDERAYDRETREAISAALHRIGIRHAEIVRMKDGEKVKLHGDTA
jgi:hypothetical protein